jgi:hypothetical protein
VGEVRQPRRPEDERQADRRHGDEQSEADAVDQQLDGAHRAAAPAGRGVVEREDHALSPVGVDGDRAGLLAAERDALGESLGVQRDRVLAGAGQLDLPAPVLVGGRGVDLLAVARGDGDVDVRDRPAAAGLQRAEERLALGGGGAGCQGRDPTGEEQDQHESQPEL